MLIINGVDVTARISPVPRVTEQYVKLLLWPVVLNEGGNTIRMEVSDRAGNVGFDEIPVRVDIRAPVLTIEPLDGTVWNALLTITLDFSDEISGVDVSTLQARLNGKFA